MSANEPSTAALASIAHHEAGHAVAALTQGIPSSRVSIVPDKESAEHVKLLCMEALECKTLAPDDAT